MTAIAELGTDDYRYLDRHRVTHALLVGLGLFILAWFGDVSPPLRRVSRLFDWLERTRAESPNEPAISRAVAA